MKTPLEVALQLLEEFEHHSHKLWPGDSTNGHTYHHNQKVSDKHVNVHFQHQDHHPDGHYDAHFSVNHEGSRNGSDTRILHHVHRVINSFVREKKPKSLHFHAGDGDSKVRDKKVKVYHALARHLAKKHGGTHDHKDGVSHVHF